MTPLACQVLVIDDDADIREAIVESLEDQGLVATGADGGAEALALLRGASALPGLILLDLMMPEMSGPEFREQQRADPALAGVPVVLLSAHADIESQAKALGAAGFMKKPVKLQALVSTVQRFVSDGAPSATIAGCDSRRSS
jgi:two-component system chemotaxis response regulator CheY